MKIGLFGIGSGICSEPGIVKEIVQQAEEDGLESVWTGEHVVLPDPRQAPSPAEPDFPMLHPSTVLAYTAAVTKTLKIGTGIVLIAQRNPLVLAKEMASLDVLSGGRLILGIGSGYLHQEFEALGIPFHERGARTDEYVEIMQTLWTKEIAHYQGSFYQFEAVRAEPHPLQKGGPPFVVGGSSDAALKRAIRLESGWYGFAMDVDTTKKILDRLQSLGATNLEISVTPNTPITEETIAQFEEIGVHRLISLMPQKSIDKLQKTITHLGQLADQ